MPESEQIHRPGPGADQRKGRADQTPRWVYAVGAVVAGLLLLVVVLHLTGNALGGHLPPAGAH
jgi:hypothetical protein